MSEQYAAPLLAVDRVLRLTDDQIVTAKVVAGNEHYLDGHYPDFPIYPGVFVIEAVEQAARLFARERRLAIRLTEVRSSRFLSALRPGDTLECHCKCTLEASGALLVNATCQHGTTKAATVKLSFQVEAVNA